MNTEGGRSLPPWTSCSGSRPIIGCISHPSVIVVVIIKTCLIDNLTSIWEIHKNFPNKCSSAEASWGGHYNPMRLVPTTRRRPRKHRPIGADHGGHIERPARWPRIAIGAAARIAHVCDDVEHVANKVIGHLLCHGCVLWACHHRCLKPQWQAKNLGFCHI